MNCPSCGNPTRPGALFCGECGTSLVNAATAAAPAAPAAAVKPVSPPPPPPSTPPAPPAPPTAPPVAPAMVTPPPAATPAAAASAVAPPPPPPPPPLVTAPPAAAAPAAADTAAPRPIISSVPGFAKEEPQAEPVAPAAPAADSSFAAPVAAAEEPDSDLDATQLSSRRRAAKWQLFLPDGRKVPVAATTLLGRNPSASARWPGAHLQPLSDPAKSISKTHAVMQIDSEGLWITDLGSTNGVLITTPDGTQLDLDEEVRTLVPAGSEVELGDFVMRVESV